MARVLNLTFVIAWPSGVEPNATKVDKYMFVGAKSCSQIICETTIFSKYHMVWEGSLGGEMCIGTQPETRKLPQVCCGLVVFLSLSRYHNAFASIAPAS